MKGDTKMTSEEKKNAVERFRKAVETQDNVIDDLYASGRLNDVIKGAIRVTLYNLNYPEKEIEEVVYECEHGTFDLYTSADLRKKSNSSL